MKGNCSSKNKYVHIKITFYYRLFLYTETFLTIKINNKYF